MRPFVDTSALYALLDADDEDHLAASGWLTGPGADPADILVTHSYVLVETAALVHHRLGPPAVRDLFDAFVPALVVAFVDAELHGRATAAYLAGLGRRISFVDRVSFQLIRDRLAHGAPDSGRPRPLHQRRRARAPHTQDARGLRTTPRHAARQPRHAPRPAPRRPPCSGRPPHQRNGPCPLPSRSPTSLAAPSTRASPCSSSVISESTSPPGRASRSATVPSTPPTSTKESRGCADASTGRRRDGPG